MRLIIDYQKKMVTSRGVPELVKAHQITIRTPDKRVMMASAYTFDEALSGAISIVQNELIIPETSEV